MVRKEVAKAGCSGLTEYPGGSTRSCDVDHLRYDLIEPEFQRQLAEVCADGARVHGERNWKNDMPQSVIINHAYEHLMKYMEGDRSELHAAKIAWAMMACIWFETRVGSGAWDKTISREEEGPQTIS